MNSLWYVNFVHAAASFGGDRFLPNIRMVQGLIIETVLDTSLETACVPTGTFFFQKFVPSNAPNYHNV